MSKISWGNLPASMPDGDLTPHMSARMRMGFVDTVFVMTGGVDRLAAWANKEENYGDFITKVWAKGMSKPQSVEVGLTDGVEALLEELDHAEAAKTIDADYEVIEPDENA